MTSNIKGGKPDNHFENDIADMQKKLSEYADNDWSWLEGLPRFTGEHTPIPFPFERMRSKDFGTWAESPPKMKK